MQRQEAIDLITESLKQFLPPGQQSANIDQDTRLIGGKALPDSTALVSLIVEVEQQVDDRFGIAITIADDRAISQTRSPFRTVSSLADYVVKLYNEAAGAACA
jgi:acyl carrier protein